jgi:hypothetical protein
MVFRLVIDFHQDRRAFPDTRGTLAGKLAGRPTVLNVKVIPFIPADFVFRCKVVRCS